MGVFVVLELKLQPGTREQAKKEAAAILPDTRKFAGYVSLNLLESTDEPDVLMIVEQWESRAHYQAYFNWRMESGTMAGTVFDMQARYDHRYSDMMTTHIRASMQRGRGLDLDQLVSLGGDNGLRGYPYRYANGDSRALLTLEQRFYTNWYPGRLFRVGAAVFVDIGRVYGSTPEGRADLGVLSDVGIGLRLANTRSGTGRVIHIDLAHPLNGGNDISSLQLLLSTEQRF